MSVEAESSNRLFREFLFFEVAGVESVAITSLLFPGVLFATGGETVERELLGVTFSPMVLDWFGVDVLALSITPTTVSSLKVDCALLVAVKVIEP